MTDVGAQFKQCGLIPFALALLTVSLLGFTIAGTANAAPNLVEVLDKRCIVTYLKGQSVDVGGLTRLAKVDERNWVSDYGGGRAFRFGFNIKSDLPIPNPVLVVPTKKSQPICALIYKGWTERDYVRAVDRYAKRSGVRELREYRQNDEGVLSRLFAVTGNGREVFVAALGVPFLSNTSWYVLTPAALDEFGGDDA